MVLPCTDRILIPLLLAARPLFHSCISPSALWTLARKYVKLLNGLNTVVLHLVSRLMFRMADRPARPRCIDKAFLSITCKADNEEVEIAYSTNEPSLE